MSNKKYLTLALTGAGIILGSLVISIINYQMIAGWFGKSGPANLGSIEVSYVSMGRFLREFGFPSPQAASWIPFWYLGFPFHLFYTPLLPFLETFIVTISNTPFWQSYRIITGLSYILVPVSVFFLGWQLSKNFVGGILAGLAYSLGPSLFYFLVPEVAADRFSLSFLDPRRFTILVRWGEGPHTLSLLFVPLVGVFFARYLEKSPQERRFKDLFLAAIFMGLTALSNSLGLFSAILLVFAMTFVKFAIEKGSARKTLFSAVHLGIVSVGLVSFWYNISFITNFFSEGGSVLKLYSSLFPWGWLAALFLGIFFFWLIRRFIKNFAIAASLVWFLILFSIVAIYYFSAPSSDHESRIELLPQALRYMTEVDMSLSIFVGVLVGSLIRFFGKIPVLGHFANLLGALGIVVASWYYIGPFIPVASKAGEQVVDLEKTQEYAIASWLDSNIDKNKGERVFVPGNYGFYLNYFTDVWQLRGGLFQASTHPWPDHIYFQLANGKNPEIALAWLKIINAKYAVITLPASAELYKEIKYLDRFESLKEAYRENGDIIYQVPLKKPSLAKAVNLEIAKKLTLPKKADDKEPILAYADWIEASPNELSFEVIDNDTYKIKGKIDKKEAVLVQMTADPGWRALSERSESKGKAKRVKTGKDPLGFLLLYPNPAAAGEEVEIILKHGPTWRQWLGYLTALATIVWVLLKFTRRSHET